MSQGEFKFGAWNEQEKKMYKEVGQTCFPSIEDVFRYGGYILLRYTSLKDKNGKDIYEGDLVKYKRYADNLICLVEFTEYSDGECYGDEKHLGWCVMDGNKNRKNTLPDISSLCEIVGNIYENPNLI